MARKSIFAVFLLFILSLPKVQILYTVTHFGFNSFCFLRILHVVIKVNEGLVSKDPPSVRGSFDLLVDRFEHAARIELEL